MIKSHIKNNKRKKWGTQLKNKKIRKKLKEWGPKLDK